MSRRDVVQAFIREHVRAGSCVIDVGVHKGLYTGAMAKATGPTGKVHAFEPNPSVIPELASNLAQHNVSIHNLAVSDSVGEKPFYVDTRKDSDSVASSLNVLEDLYESGAIRRIQVDCTTLDAFCQEVECAPEFMKIDVEGHEIAVIRGATHTIDRYRPYIVFEFWET